MNEGKEGREKGNIKTAGNKYRVATYLLEKIQRDFPDWSRETVGRDLEICRVTLQEIESHFPPPPTPAGSFRVTCSWQIFSPGQDFEPEDGNTYKISLEGEDRQKLVLSFKKLKPYNGDARICVQLENTRRETVLQDTKNRRLFQREEGGFQLSLSVPADCPFFLAEFTEDQIDEPVILSNILHLP